MKNWLEENESLTIKIIYAFTAIVYALVISLHYLPEASSIPGFVSKLTLVNAVLNGTCFLLLIFSLAAVKRKLFKLHQMLNTSAMALSLVFLLSYVVNHYFKGDVIYGGDYKAVYYFILVTHIVLAAASLPFILLAYFRGLQGNIQKHKRLVRFTYPVWLYVTLTGVIVYIFLAPYY